MGTKVRVVQQKGKKKNTPPSVLQLAFEWAITPDEAKRKRKAEKLEIKIARLKKAVDRARDIAAADKRFIVIEGEIRFVSSVWATLSTEIDAKPPKGLRHQYYYGVVYQWTNRPLWLCTCKYVICRNFLRKIVGKRVGPKCPFCK